MKFIKYLLAPILLSLFTSVVDAKVYSTLNREAQAIFNILSIQNYHLLQMQRVFGLANVVWVFNEKRGFKRLLESLDNKQHGFTYINVLPQQLLLSRLSDQQEIIFWVKRHTHDAFSGTLSVMRKGELKNSIAPLSWLAVEADVLLDIESNEPYMARQWIYRFTWDSQRLNHWLVTQLQANKWQVNNEEKGDFFTWRKGDKELSYYLVSDEQGTLLYVFKRKQ